MSKGLLKNLESIPSTENDISITEINDKESRNSFLKDIFLECLLPHQFSNELMLHIMMDNCSETLPCIKISPTEWKVNGNITL
ncbi:hypothetical protein HYPSUDRAFT_40576 [Hypholoma sublateritium FD-334 SS-4]|uniref:Uncharacterized protein n=1 Tax=Hypholoma sublateritium (strain FD-334 SS-4) TaxID=945553 RepID=A0A0D2PSR9_HYPSF|nr:hypothetical protein HYPSUDRAFT_40576 [Hypholoma sublateritium FD-334 SS-4]